MTALLLALCLTLAVVLAVLLACQWQAARMWRMRHATGLVNLPVREAPLLRAPRPA